MPTSGLPGRKDFPERAGGKKIHYNRLQLLAVLITMVLALKHRTASTPK
jgi:hypothetical protein